MRGKKKIMCIGLIAALLFSILFPVRTSAFSVGASGAILMEQQSGRVLFEKQPHEVRRIASITKIMTAILAIESGKMDEFVKVSKEAVYTEGSSIYLQQGEKIKLEDLVYGLMLRSGNDAATAIAEHVGGSVEGFVFLMNQKAAEIGMSHTIFSNPHGLDDHEEHYSTPYDMALLTRYVMEDDKYKEISKTKVYKFTRETGPQSWTNKNRLLTEKYEYCTGGKTGFTKRAGRTLVTTATKNGVDLIAVTLDGPDDWNDHTSMFEYGFDNFQMKEILNEGPIIEIKGVKNKAFYLKDAVYYPLTSDESEQLNVDYKLLHKKELNDKVSGTAGLATIYFQNEPIRQVPIYIKQIKEKKDGSSWWEKMKDFIFNSGSVSGDD